MAELIAHYRGKPLSEHTKEELIEIVIELGQMLNQESHEHARQLDVLQGLIKR